VRQSLPWIAAVASPVVVPLFAWSSVPTSAYLIVALAGLAVVIVKSTFTFLLCWKALNTVPASKLPEVMTTITGLPRLGHTIAGLPRLAPKKRAGSSPPQGDGHPE